MTSNADHLRHRHHALGFSAWVPAAEAAGVGEAEVAAAAVMAEVEEEEEVVEVAAVVQPFHL